jgi:hypothetical protein
MVPQMLSEGEVLEEAEKRETTQGNLARDVQLPKRRPISEKLKAANSSQTGGACPIS